MHNFIFQNPTKLVFGKGQIAHLATLIPTNRKLMLTFGGGSVKQNGVYQQVVEALKGHRYIEFWGIEANPRVETLRKAIALGKENHIDFILSVGGGSALDGTKLIAAGIASNTDAWEIVLSGKANSSIPFASVMTLPATGSEMNTGAVISREETKEKRAFYNQHPEFSILDPESTYSLPPYQIACGLTDIFVHVMEQYLTVTNESRLMDRWAESILQTIVEIAPKIQENQTNYDIMADYTLAATLALNGMIAMGVTQDWATHMIGHEITALHGTTHGESLSIVLPGTMRILREQKRAKILQYGERIFGINNGTETARIDAAIAATERLFRSLGLKTRLSEHGIGQASIDTIANRFIAQKAAYGEADNVDGNMAKRILESCL